jgi:hypothetical protein
MKALSELVHDFRKRSGIDLYQLRREAAGHWVEAAGRRIAPYSETIGFVRGELRVAAYHPAAGMEIRSREQEILDALNAVAGRQVFERIVVVRRRGPGAGNSSRKA